MTDTALPGLRLGGCREVSVREARDVEDVVEADRFVTSPAAERIAGHGVAGGWGGRLFTRGGPSQSLFFVAGSILPIRCDDADAEAFARMLLHHRVEPSAVHGRRKNVLRLWSHLEQGWGPAREVRDAQQLMVLLDRPAVEAGETGLRLATVEDFELVLPAAAAVYVEELGSDPFQTGGGTPFRRRVARTIALGRTWIRVVDGEVVFKVDVGVRAPRVAQLQGVWTRPDLRRRGWASRCSAHVCEVLQSEGVTPTLVVNERNAAGVATYRRIGMVPVADCATVLV